MWSRHRDREGRAEMPVAIRANSAQRHTGRISAIVCACLMATNPVAASQAAIGGIPETAPGVITRVPWHEVAGLALTLGVVLFAVISAIALLRTRRRAAVEAADLRGEIDALKIAAGDARALLLSDPQVLMVWPLQGGDPVVIGE